MKLITRISFLALLFLPVVALSDTWRPGDVVIAPPYITSLYDNPGAHSFDSVDAAFAAAEAAYFAKYPSQKGVCAFARTYMPPGQTVLYDNDGNPLFVIAKETTVPDGGPFCGTGSAPGFAVYVNKVDHHSRAPGPPCCGGLSVGNPINVGEGTKYQVDDDYQNGDLIFSRFYSSSDSMPPSHIGVRWRHSYDIGLSVLTPNDNQGGALITMYREDGKRIVFSRVNGVWASDGDLGAILSETDNASDGRPSGFVYRNKQQAEFYSSDGVLRAIKRNSGLQVNLSYSDAATPISQAPAKGLLTSVTDSSGRSLSFYYNSDSTINKIMLPDGRAITYSYDGIGNLVKVTREDGTYLQYVYNDSSVIYPAGQLPNALTGVIDERGIRYSNFYYNGITKRATGTNHANYTYSFGIGDDGTVTYPGVKKDNGADYYPRVTYTFQNVNGLNKISSATGDNCALCGSVASMSYDGNGNPAKVVDRAGTVTNYVFDAHGLETSKTEAAGASEQKTTNTVWDTNLVLPLQRNVLNASNVVVSGLGWVYNTRGQPLARCEIDSALAGGYVCAASGAVPAGVRRWRYNYCDSIDSTQCPVIGLLLSVIGPRSDITDTTSYTYYLSTDESGCGTLGGACHRGGDAYQVTDAAGHVTTNVAYDKIGHLVRQRDANGVITDWTFHARGWLLSRIVRANTDGSPSARDSVTQYAYSAVGDVIKVTDPDGVSLSYTYDDARRLTDVVDATGNRTHYVLDSEGNRVQEQFLTSSGDVKSSFSRSYNAHGNLEKITDGLGGVVLNATFADSYDALGRRVHSADALNIERKLGYDGLSRLVSTLENYGGSDASTGNTQSVFAYDANSNLLGIGDPDGLNTTYDVDGLGNVLALHSPDTGTTSYVYDVAGNRTQSTDARGIVSHSTFDALNRLTGTTYPSVDANVSYRYDEADSVTGCVGSYPLGRLTRVVEATVTTIYCYDARGNVVQKRQIQGATIDTVNYSYTLADRLASIRTPDGTAIQYSRDSTGRISGAAIQPLGGSAKNVVTNVSYLPFGPVVSYTLGNGQTLTRTYDANYAVTDIVSPALNLHFARDAMGNITALGNAQGANPAIETYSYDSLYRLTGLKGAQGQAIESYTYNKTGDRLSKMSNGLAAINYGYQAGTHWLTSIGSSARTYDANGNTTGNATSGNTFGYGYNDRDRMTVVQRNGQTIANFTYNSKGQRVAKSAAVNQRFVYDEGSQLLGEYGAISRSYVWLDDLPVAMVDTSGSVSTVSYVHADGLDTPRAVADEGGAVVWQWPIRGNSFGEQQPTSSLGYALNLRLPGQYYDAETGLHDNVNRSYDPSTGRYGQPDPIGQLAGPSLFGYVGGNPLRYVDPLGLARHDPNSAHCLALARKIQRVKDGIDKRWVELDANDGIDGVPLGEYLGPGEENWQTRRGHRTLINREDWNLRRLQDKYDRECGPPPPPIPLLCPQAEPSPKPFPAPAPAPAPAPSVPPAGTCVDPLECATH